MQVRRLDPVLIDRIAAGEVVARPAAAVKELVENALDADARSIEVVVEAGGRRLIRIVDDGHGMSAGDLELAVDRHATSKLAHGDLFAIRTLGFRGEALPSIGAVARLSVTTRRQGDASGWSIVVDGGAKGEVRPAPSAFGTRVEVSDLFSATPARLKFLKGDRAEAGAVADAVKRIAMAYPHVRFVVAGEGISSLDLPAEGTGVEALLRRLGRLLGPDFPANAIRVDGGREDVSVSGFASLPTYHRGTAGHVHMTVNGRPVRDKLLMGAVKGAYSDVLPSDRHPAMALSILCDPRAVDVNVHPAKTEVRFRDPAMVRGLVVGTLRRAIAEAGSRTSTTGGERTLAAMRQAAPIRFDMPYVATRDGAGGFLGHAEPAADARASAAEPEPEAVSRPLGAARAQIHGNYIVAQTERGMVIVDQHAAHERLVYERLKRQRAENGIQRQMLLVPEIVEMDPREADRLVDHADVLATLGLVVEGFGPGAVAVREVPAALAGRGIQGLVRAVADSLAEQGEASALSDRLDAVLSSMACHGSVRSGRLMRPEEMNALLREMEATPLSGTCNHGRPTVLALSLLDIERLFGRT